MEEWIVVVVRGDVRMWDDVGMRVGVGEVVEELGKWRVVVMCWVVDRVGCRGNWRDVWEVE